MVPVLTRSAACLALVLCGLTPVTAITFGVPDGDAHPNVGLIMYRIELFHPDIGAYYYNWGFCSGALIAPALFLTAAHCAYGEEPNLPILWVSFDTNHSLFEVLAWPDWPEPNPNHPRVRVQGIHVHPAYRPWSEGQDAGHTDLAVLTLDLATATGPLPAPAAVPSAGILDASHEDHTLMGQKFTAVGYGQDIQFGGGPPAFIDAYATCITGP